MNSKRRKRVRILGKILFVLYIGFIIYFLLFSDLYGRTGQMDTYRYNLELFKEIKRFWNYRVSSRLFCYVYKFIRECSNFCPVWIFLCPWRANTEASFLHCFIALD